MGLGHVHKKGPRIPSRCLGRSLDGVLISSSGETPIAREARKAMGTEMTVAIKEARTKGRQQHLSAQERAAAGKAARSRAPRSKQGEWSLAQRTCDPLELLGEQASTRAPDLVPIRHGRMAASPFSYYRGAAYPMAADLSSAARTGLEVQLCGDAHLANFGGFASPERDFVFDLNDFDETNPGPFEWDVKRLAATVWVGARSGMSIQSLEGS